MKLTELTLKNFRKLHDVKIDLREATFLIGPNNAGKSSTIEAIELLLSSGSKLNDTHRSKYYEEDENGVGEEKVCRDDVVIMGLFTDVDPSIVTCRGFNPERLIKVPIDSENYMYSFRYRIRLSAEGKVFREMEMHTAQLKPEYVDCQTWQDFVDKGADVNLFEGKVLSKKLSKSEREELLMSFPDLCEVNEESSWFENPGGIPGNVLSKLPHFLKIDADVLSEEMDASKSGTLYKLLSYIFSNLKDKSENYKKAVSALEALSKEMDPNDESGTFGKLMKDLNKVVDDVFPRALINIKTDLTKADTLKPLFEVSMSSNVSTEVSGQGTGLIRSAVFALLRYYKKHMGKNEDESLIIGFEEPELFLHPTAAENMRRVIYELADTDCQIVATTHSPYMIDLSQKPKQVLNSFSRVQKEFASVCAFNLSEAFLSLQEDDKARVKMIQKIDDYVSRVFFTQKVIVVEGNTEDIVFKKTINVMPEEIRKDINGKYQIIKAMGKATMISFIRYLRALNVDLFVVHDEDEEVKGAEAFNNPILLALGNDAFKRCMMHNCIEDELGYKAPSSDKPYNAFKFVDGWNKWTDVPENWRNKMKDIFQDYKDSL